MVRKHHTLSDQIITPRDINLSFQTSDIKRHWFGDDPWTTHLFNGLFFAVPDGERWVMESARIQVRKVSDPQLKDTVRAFIRQEAAHSREHDVVNALMNQHGIPAAKVERFFNRMRKAIQARSSDNMQASIAAAIEHFTAILSEVMLQHPELFITMDEKNRALVYWHMVEETEHKAVSHDLYSATVGTDIPAYLLRIYGLLVTFGFGFGVVLGNQLYLLQQDGELTNLKSARYWVKTMLLNPGIMRRLLTASVSYLQPGFHPWDRDNSAIIKVWREAYEASGDAVHATNQMLDWQLACKYDHNPPTPSLAPAAAQTRQLARTLIAG